MKHNTHNFDIKISNRFHVKPNPLPKCLLTATSNAAKDSFIGVHLHEHESPKQMIWIDTVGPKFVKVTLKAKKVPSDGNFSWSAVKPSSEPTAAGSEGGSKFSPSNISSPPFKVFSCQLRQTGVVPGVPDDHHGLKSKQ